MRRSLAGHLRRSSAREAPGRPARGRPTRGEAPFCITEAGGRCPVDRGATAEKAAQSIAVARISDRPSSLPSAPRRRPDRTPAWPAAAPFIGHPTPSEVSAITRMG
ncbi:hypothetical protein AB0C95_06415 [Streptomyces caniferus]|uniref:hypothetical protein n=1 Tax=Streptomyces caniferus TaxID=285557 RepID=UPI0033CCE8FC